MNRRRRRRNNPGRTLVIAVGIIVLLTVAHFWVYLLVGLIGTAGFIAFRRYSRPPQVSNRVTHHERMTREQTAETREAQRPRIVALGPNATETDRRMYERDNPPASPAAQPPGDDVPPF